MPENIRDILKHHFGFLEKEYGLKLRAMPSDRWDRKWLPSVAYSNETVGVFIEYDAREQYLGVTIHRLDDGRFPIRGGRIATSQGWSLNGRIYLDDPQGLVGSWMDESLGRHGRGLSFDDYVVLVAGKLRAHGDALLRGDFSRTAEIMKAEQEIRTKRERG